MKKEEKLVFQITNKSGILCYKVNGKTFDVLDALLSVNVALLNEFVFNVSESIPIKSKFELIDSFMGELKKELEQTAVYNV